MRQRPLATAPPKRRRKAPPAGRPPHPSEISAGLPTPKQQQRLSKTTLTPAQRRVARRLVREYQAGPKPGSAVRALDKLGRIYTDNPVARNPIIGRKGLLGGVEDLFKMADPIALEQTLKRRAEHPLRMDKGLSAGIVFRGGGVERFRVPEGTADITEVAKPPPGEIVAESLGAAKRTAAESRRTISEQKAERVVKAEAARSAAGGGRAGHEAFLAELKGEYTKPVFERLQQGALAHGDLEQLMREVDAHPHLQPLEKSATRAALQAAVEEGKAPRPFEIRHLQTVFGPDNTRSVLDHASRLRRLGLLAQNVINVPRSLQTTLDVSYALRQGLVPLHSHPRIWKQSIGPMFKALASEKNRVAAEEAIRSHPDYHSAVTAGVPFTGMEDIAHREEAFSSPLAEQIPLVGHPVRASGRAYTTAANVQRMKLYSHMLGVARAEREGTRGRGVLGRTPGFRGTPDPESPAFQRQLAAIVGTFTGRGKGGPTWERMAPVLNNFLFSPRFIKARINMLNPIWYARLNPFARRQAFRALVRMAGTTALLLETAHHFTGASVGVDPRSADFAKIRFGNTRLDIGGAFQQYIRLVSQLVTSKVISSTTGQTITLGHGYGQLSQFDLLRQFAEHKLSPTASFIDDYLHNTTGGTGHAFSLSKEALQRLVPLVAQDALDLYHSSDSIPAAVGGYAVSATGLGLQTYANPATSKAKAKLHEATKTQNVHLANLVRQGVLPRDQAKRMRQALDIYDKRNQINTTIDAATKNKPLTRERQKLDALLGLLQEHKVLKPSEVKHWRGYVASHPELTPKQIQKARSWFWRDSGLERAITWYRDKAGAND